ncbi:MAG: acyltransferase family protein [Nakamurella sp.]
MSVGLNDTIDAQARPPQLKPFRADIQGLRAIAVIVVVANHLFGWPSGGFVGVDVFYVLSGFLITGLLLKEYRRTGWISFRGFYARRIRRILPVAVLVLVVTVVTAYFLWYTPRADQTLLDSIAAFFFVENWHLIRIGTDYLQANGPVSPVQHYWSLSVEEQFYVAWPWFILLIAGLAARKFGAGVSVRFVSVAIAVVIAGSFSWSVLVSSTYPEEGYFETVSRVWELAAGALLAALAAQSGKIGNRLAAALMWGGLALLIGSTLLINPDLPFPGPWAALPVLGTAMIIVGGSNGRRLALLTNRATSYVGDISYSLYLWHFPVIVFTLSVVERSVAAIVFMIIAMTGLSVLSYKYVEDPIRRSSWLRSWDRKSLRRWPQMVGAAAVGLVMVVLIAVQLLGPDRVMNGALLRPYPVADASFEPRDWRDQAALSAHIVEAARATEWPASVSPALETLSTADGAPAMDFETGCRNTVVDQQGPVRHCERPGNGADANTVIVVGDSVALSWVPAVEQALPGWRVLGFGFANCPAIPAKITRNSKECTAAQNQMLQFATDNQADMVITSSVETILTRLAGATGADAERAWAEATSRFVDSYSPADVVVLGTPPPWGDPPTCLTKLAEPSDCAATVGELWWAKQRAEATATAGGHGTFIDVHDWFCTPDDVCPSTIDGVQLRIDNAHLSDAASQSYGSRLAAAIAQR